MSTLDRKPEESALDFVERADASGASEDAINSVLKEHFGLCEDGEIKSLKLKSEVFWHGFYTDRVRDTFERGGTRYAAIKFIERKNGQAGQRALSNSEIHEIVASVGDWPP